MAVDPNEAFAKYKTYDFIYSQVHDAAVANAASETASQIDATTSLIARIQESCAAYNQALYCRNYTETCKIIFPVMDRNQQFLEGLHKEFLEGISAKYNSFMASQNKKYTGFCYDVNAMLNTLKTFNFLLGNLLYLKQK